MLILTREIGDDITITVLKGDGAQRCKLGVEAPKHVAVRREEIVERDEIEAQIDSRHG